MPTLNHMGAVFTAHFQFRLCIINLCACQVSLMHFTPLHSTAGLSRGCASLNSKWAVYRFAHEPDQARVRLVGYIIRFVESIIKPLWFFHLSFSLSFIISFPEIRPWAFLQLWCKTAQSSVQCLNRPVLRIAAFCHQICVFCSSHLVTTSRPTDGVDVYFEKPVDDTEHANFLRAKTDLEERRMKRINEVNFTGLRTG